MQRFGFFWTAAFLLSNARAHQHPLWQMALACVTHIGVLANCVT